VRELKEFGLLILTNPMGWLRMQLAWVYSNALLILLGLIFWGFVVAYSAPKSDTSDRPCVKASVESSAVLEKLVPYCQKWIKDMNERLNAENLGG
jgi:hypothetical protein